MKYYYAIGSKVLQADAAANFDTNDRGDIIELKFDDNTNISVL